MDDCKKCKLEKTCNKKDSLESLQVCFDKQTRWDWWEYPHIFWLRYIVRSWEDLCLYSKRTIQRAIRGWGDSDLWNMHCFLTDTILNMLVELKRVKGGIPATIDPAIGKFTGDPDKDYDEKRWNNILDEMIEGFAILKKCDLGDLEWGEQLSSNQKIKLQTSMRKRFPSWTLTTREEEKKVANAWKLFTKYYQSLWD